MIYLLKLRKNKTKIAQVRNRVSKRRISLVLDSLRSSRCDRNLFCTWVSICFHFKTHQNQLCLHLRKMQVISSVKSSAENGRGYDFDWRNPTQGWIFLLCLSSSSSVNRVISEKLHFFVLKIGIFVQYKHLPSFQCVLKETEEWY